MCFVVNFSRRTMWYPAKITKETKAESSTNIVVVIAASLSAVLVLVLVGIIAYLYIRNKNLKKVLTDEEVQEFLNGKKRLDQHAKDEENPDVAVEYMKFNNEYALAKTDFSIGFKNYILNIMQRALMINPSMIQCFVFKTRKLYWEPETLERFIKAWQKETQPQLSNQTRTAQREHLKVC